MGILPDVTGSRFFKMAATKPEVLISLFPDKIATPFQRLPQIFGILEINGTYVYNMSDVNGSKKPKMAATKPEVKPTSGYIAHYL